MTVQQTAYPPLPHRHNGSDILDQDLTKYYAAAVMTTDINAVFNTDTYAAQGWAKETDPYGLVQLPITPGTGEGLTRLYIPKDGFYEIELNLVVACNEGQKAACKISRTGPVNGYSVATDARVSQSSGEFAILRAFVIRKFVTNDVIYWSWWTDQNTPSNPAKVRANHYGGVKSKLTIEWIGA